MTVRLSTYTVALVSTAHLRAETMQTLESWAGPDPLPGQPMTCAQDTYGFWVWTGYHEHDEVPAELREILRLTQSEGCEYARFDRDEEADGALPVFEEAPENSLAVIRDAPGAAGFPTAEEG